MKHLYFLVCLAALTGCGGGSSGGAGPDPVVPPPAPVSKAVVTTLAGGYGAAGSEAGVAGQSREARVEYASGAAVDAAGNVYVADADLRTYYSSGPFPTRYAIWKISPAGLKTFLAGGVRGFEDGTGAVARFADPRVGGVDAAGNVYVADTSNHAVRKITPGGLVTTLAGGGAGRAGYVDGPVASARFDSPGGVAADAAGNVFVADSVNKVIRKISTAGVVSTLAGGGAGPLTDGQGANAGFSSPLAVALDEAGTAYVADGGAIRKVSPAGVVTTLAAPPPLTGAGGQPAAYLGSPTGLAVNRLGEVYVTLPLLNAIRKITPSGQVTYFAGRNHSQGGFEHGLGTAAQFNRPFSIAVDQVGTIYVADSDNHSVRMITPEGQVSSLAGPALPTVADGTGTSAGLRFPQDGVVDSKGNVFVADCANYLRQVSPQGVVGTWPDSGGPLISSGSLASCVLSLSIDGADNIYRLSWPTLQKITPAGATTTLYEWSPDRTSGDVSRLRYSAADSNGNVYFTYQYSSGFRYIYKISPDGVLGPMLAPGVGQGYGPNPGYLAVAKNGVVFVMDQDDGKIRRLTADGALSVVAAFEGAPGGIAVDGSENVYFVAGNVVYKVTSGGIVTTVAGNATPGFVDGVGENARFRGVSGLALDRAGHVYVFDSGNQAIRKIMP